MKDLRRLIIEAKPLHGMLAVIGLLSVINSVVWMATPWLFRELVNFLTYRQLSNFFDQFVSATNPTSVLLLLVGAYTVLNLFSSVVDEIKWYFQSTSSVKAWALYLMKTMHKLHEFSVGYFEKKSPGWLRERIHGGVEQIYGISQSILVDILPMCVNFAIAVVILFKFNVNLSLAFVIAAPLIVGISIWRARIMRYWEKKIRNQREKAGKGFFDNLYHYQLIKEFGQEDYEQAKLNKIYQRTIDLRRRQELLLRWTSILRELIYILSDLWVYGYGGYLVLTGVLSIGDLVLFISYLEKVLNPLSRVLKIYDSLQVGMVSIKRLFGIWDRQDEISDAPDAKPLQIKSGKIEFKHTTFSYKLTKRQKHERIVFKDLNITIQPKEVIALVGPSGAGKSTLIKLLLRFYDPTKGKILIDGQDIKTVTQRSLRKHVSSVMQDVAIFNNTIGYNLKYGRPHSNQTEIKTTAKIANLYDFIMSLRQKFKTPVGERGIRLSGGERQRLAIARALLKNAPILVMDEATSALDSENEKKIQEAMWELIKGRTTIIIAHRLSTIMRADRIIVFDQKGKIIEQGRHGELMDKNGYYSRLFKMQGEFLSM